MMVTQVHMCCTPHHLHAVSMVQMPATALHEASTALQDLQAEQHIFLASDLYFPNKASLQIGNHVLQSPGANT